MSASEREPETEDELRQHYNRPEDPEANFKEGEQNLLLTEYVAQGAFLEDYGSDTDEIDGVQQRISDLAELDLGRFKKLERLCLRGNQIVDIEGLDGVADTLVELDLYDNKISHIRNLSKLTNLKMLDLSFNKIKHIKHIEALVNLVDLYFVSNRISHIENLDALVNLENLELGANKIRVIENLEKLVKLRQLWLGKNKITKFENLDALQNLKIISIQSNRLTSLKGLEQLVNLEELYTSHNAITKIEGLENNVNLRTLDVAHNQLRHIENISHLTKLEEFWANNNLFENETFDEVERELGGIKTLETVYLEGNPFEKNNRATYRNKIKLALPQAKQIDAMYVSGV
ncbi:hypothetical protein BCR43DRAFT_481537 [Syncephalastrum racemosum]|uniref:Protein phosphatase 1 regulatory subunit 7 n=1 Tax=Syncephalastrum racemosum TaxID=13706 RepID=A0A1X2HS79_SYNRA|nr:hypothetical protein BCR43DRAFT_481537 [Syncephalastrum racemosum]